MSRSIEKKIDLLVEEGYFSEEEIKKEAFKTLLRERSDLRSALAVEEYKRGEITLNRAAEIAGITTEEMKKKVGRQRDFYKKGSSFRERKRGKN
ncbi:MAG: UPF0175 family protein [Candidatus Natronoplasma sp.]